MSSLSNQLLEDAMSFFSSIRASASALTAQRLRMDVIANNIANASTTRTAEGGPYQREQVVFVPGSDTPSFLQSLRTSASSHMPVQGVLVSAIEKDQTPGNTIYDPQHPDANAEGFVEMPNVDVVTEMTDMISATRAYEANVTVLNAIKSMALRALDIGR